MPDRQHDDLFARKASAFAGAYFLAADDGNCASINIVRYRSMPGWGFACTSTNARWISEVGRAQFSRIEHWLKRAVPTSGLISTPTEYFVERLHTQISPLVCAPPPETDWLPLMRMLRNKSAHLGTSLFRQVGLHRKAEGTMFAFIPREWPYMWEKHIKPAGGQPLSSPKFSDLLRDGLIHQDLVTYTRGLLLKVRP